MSHTDKELSGEDQILLEIYKEQTASWKHEDDTLYKFGAVLLPVSFVALGVPYIGEIEASNLTILETISTIGGIILMTFWVAYVHATHAKVNARFKIINQIEKDWKIKGHRDIPKIRDMMYEPRKRLKLKTYFLETQIFYVYWIAAFILTAYRFFKELNSFTASKESDTFIAIVSSLLVVAPVLVIMFICLVIACKYRRSIKQGDENSQRVDN